jgi:flagella basal body P-ring formation protein FlgA
VTRAALVTLQRLALCLLPGLSLFPHTSHAEEVLALTPRRIIYPGDLIHDDAIEEKRIEINASSENTSVRTRDEIIGKIARRTLIPGQSIPLSGIDTPRLIKIGASVKIVFSSEGLQIIATGVAQQAGGIGDVIRVRNEESGVFVSGRIMPDGSIAVGDS